MLYLRILSTVFAGILVTVLLRPAISEYLVTRTQQNPEVSVRMASRVTGEDARYHYALGSLSYKDRDKAQAVEAVNYYRDSLRRDPTRALAWLDLSKIYKENGQEAHAEFTVRQAVSVDRANPRVLWEAGILYLLDGRIADASPFFRAYLTITPSDQEHVSALLQGVGARAAFIMERVVPETYASRSKYFRFLINHKQYSQLWDTWEIRRTWKPANKDYLVFCDFLIERGDLEAAQPVWAELVENGHPARKERSAANLLYNGDFEYPIHDGGFDWKIGKAEGVTIGVDPEVKKTGSSSLAATFNGKTNPGVYVAQQVVRVKPNEQYHVSAVVKTENLTTKNGILLEVLDHMRGAWSARSEVLTGTSNWQPVELTFAAPANCNAVRIGLKRERSEKFDNKICGKVWIDSVSMQASKGDR
jgi:tetratricopeptide (TPR) repeat protein